MRKKTAVPCNPNASAEARALLTYLATLSGNGIITGQHTQTRDSEELRHIQAVTGELPALCGFELLAYSPAAERILKTCDEACKKEILENQGTLETALAWAEEQNGLLTFTWHWFSPLGGENKSFFSRDTRFDASLVLCEGTPEREAFFSDMEHMAGLLKQFRDKRIPILWRPFHESEGDWFWWAAKGPAVARALYLLMYEYFTATQRLDNLLWVWNSPLPEGYVGDAVTDIISRDMYPPKHVHTEQREAYEALAAFAPLKVTAIAETGTLPSIARLAETRVPWAWYMTWSNEYGKTGEWTSDAELRAAYENPYAITLSRLPRH